LRILGRLATPFPSAPSAILAYGPKTTGIVPPTRLWRPFGYAGQEFGLAQDLLAWPAGYGDVDLAFADKMNDFPFGGVFTEQQLTFGGVLATAR
jgi:hypothetical protein